MLGVLLFLSTAYAHDVCIIGAGIGGAATAYQLSLVLPDASIVVYERSNYIGGRLKSILFHGAQVNLGGDAWTSANENMMALQEKLQIPLDTENYGGNGKTSVWNGRTLLRTDTFDPITDGEVYVALELLKTNLRKNYRDLPIPFSSIREYVSVGLEDYMTTSAESFADKWKWSSYFKRVLWEPLTRTIYDQELNMTLFGALVSLLSEERSFAAKGGNNKFVEALFNASSAVIKLKTQVGRISGTNLYDTNGNLLANCNVTVLAAPMEMAMIQGLPEIPLRTYHHWWVTMVASSGFNASYFGLPATSTIADSLLTTQNSSSSWTTCAVLAKGNNATKIFKCFSNRDISPELDQLFMGPGVDHVSQYWGHTFPNMVPGVESFQPIELAPRIYYLNTMESVAVAMEGSVIAGRNVANLIKRDLK